MKALLRDLLRWYLHRCPITEGKGFLYRTCSEGLLPEDPEVTVHLFPGFSMALDLSETAQREIFYFGTYERKESALIRRLLRPGDVFWDVGANIGYYTLMAARCVGPSGRVVAFEPFPPAWARLQKNVGLNAFGQIRCVNVAVSRAVEIATLYFQRNVPDGEASLVAPPGHASTVTCDTLTLDGFLSELNERSPTVVKADAEGSEKAILKGAVGILASPQPPILLLEMEDEQCARHGTSRSEIQQMLSGLGFVAYQLRGRRWMVCPEIRAARYRSILWVNPSHDTHRGRLQAIGIPPSEVP